MRARVSEGSALNKHQWESAASAGGASRRETDGNQNHPTSPSFHEHTPRPPTSSPRSRLIHLPPLRHLRAPPRGFMGRARADASAKDFDEIYRGPFFKRLHKIAITQCAVQCVWSLISSKSRREIELERLQQQQQQKQHSGASQPPSPPASTS